MNKELQTHTLLGTLPDANLQNQQAPTQSTGKKPKHDGLSLVPWSLRDRQAEIRKVGIGSGHPREVAY